MRTCHLWEGTGDDDDDDDDDDNDGRRRTSDDDAHRLDDVVARQLLQLVSAVEHEAEARVHAVEQRSYL